MQLKRLNCPRLALLLLLLSLAALSAGCPSDGSGNQGATPNSTPSGPGAEDRPIIITGGSLNLEYDPRGYTDCGTTGTVKKFCMDGYKISSVAVFDDNGANDNSDKECGTTGDLCPGGNCSIEVSYKKGGADSLLTITSDAAAKKVTVEYDTGHLGERPSASRMRFSKSANIQGLLIRSPTTTTPLCDTKGKVKSTILIIASKA
ncbi:MAG TPA: hypothetical protein VGV38_17415 [Pyrinomonadaceae bacterium]|nr:hypothetical protein [Pyrinomonadaceae bacterium]